MATIDLRHLVQKEYDVVKFIGDLDGEEYTIPVKKSVGASLLLQQYMDDFNKKREPGDYKSTDSIELSYLCLTAWIRNYYPEITLEWVKQNITSDELLSELMKLANQIFFPKVTEAGTPKKNPKKRRS